MKLFRRKTAKEKLQKQYESKLTQAHSMATVNRKKSDQLIYEAEQIMQKIENEN